jgi:hypothetical protein
MSDEQNQNEPVEERPGWLPEKFKDETAFVEAYRHLERRLTEQSEEIKQLREATQTELDGGLTPEQLESLSTAEPYVRVVAGELARNTPEEVASTDVLGMLQRVAQEATQQTDRAVGEALGAVPDPETVAVAVGEQAVQLLASTHPNYDEQSGPLIAAELETNPALAAVVNGALFTNDPATVATALSGVLAAATSRQQAAENRQQAELMKLSAQTMSGAGTRPVPPSTAEAEWNAIVRAGRPSGGY